jgi:tRNA pseudouridine55 synthase
MQSEIENQKSKIQTDGVIVVNKPGGMTSHDVVSRIRRIYGTKRVGHTGTLDPLATGVLVICLGQATRIVEYLTATRKEYHATAVFGVTTDSEDATGVTLTETDAGHLTEADLVGILPQFRGSILQTPPMVSALHHEGKRLYDLARQGIEVERAARPVQITRLELTSFIPGRQATAEIEVECSTGTYIRTICADLGKALGVGGMMSSLLRTRVGAFTLSEAHTLEQLENMKMEASLPETVRTISDALPDWPRATLNPSDIDRIVHGQTVCMAEGQQSTEDGNVLLLDEAGSSLGIARIKGAELAPIKVFSAVAK